MGRTGWALYLLSAGLASLTWVACSALQKSNPQSETNTSPAGSYRIAGPDVAGFAWLDLCPGGVWRSHLPTREFTLDPSGAWVATPDGQRLVCDDHAGRYWVFARRGKCWVGGVSQLTNPVRLILVTDRAEEQRP